MRTPIPSVSAAKIQLFSYIAMFFFIFLHFFCFFMIGVDDWGGEDNWDNMGQLFFCSQQLIILNTNLFLNCINSEYLVPFC